MSGTVRSPGVNGVFSPYAFAGLGVATGVYCAYALAQSFGPRLPGVGRWVIEVALLGVPAIGHSFVGYWLHTGGFEDDEMWRVGYTASASGVIGVAVVVIALSVVAPDSIPLRTGLLLLVGIGTEAALIGVLIAVVRIEGLHRSLVGRNRWEPNLSAGETTEVESVETVSDPATGGSVEQTVGEQLQTLHSLVRHDVRNHLNVVNGRLDLLVEEADNVNEEHLKSIEAQTTAVLNLLDEVELAVEILSSDDPVGSVELATVVDEEVRIATRSHENVSIDVAVPSGVSVRANDLLGAVIDNLLSNAIQHHDRTDKEIEVTAEVDSDRVVLSVADDGPGVPDREKPSVFDAEYGDGSGMGLYLVAGLVNRYGGDVSISDNDPRGTIVRVTLPRAE